MHPLHKAVGGWMENRRSREMDVTYVGQGMEELLLEFPP